jgi:hypothetical protein
MLELVLTSAASAIDPNLVGWWKLNEGSGITANDSSGNEIYGLIYNSPTWVSGKIGSYALQFNGVNNYVDCGNSTLLNISAQITMACWVKIPPTVRVPPGESWQPFLAKGDGAWRLSRSQTGGTVHMGFNNSTPIGWFDSITEVNDGNWHHVAGTFDGVQAKIYIDGQLDNSISTPTPATINTTADILHLGHNSVQTTRYLNGTLDDVRLYKRALKGLEIPIIMYGEWYPFAYDPEPADEATVSTRVVTLKWTPGEKVASTDGHKVYFDPTKAKVQARSGCQVNNVSTTNPSYLIPTPLDLEKTYYWAVDEVNDGNNWSGPVWSFAVAPYIASHPDPCDGAQLVESPVALKWIAGTGAVEHHVYFGDSETDVNLGTPYTDKGTRTEPNYYAGALGGGKFYWRIDEVNATTVFTGDVWNFTTVGPLLGLRSEYYNNTDLSGVPVLIRKDLNINFDWATSSPDPNVSSDNFSVRWIGELDVPKTETYTFAVTYLRTEDSVRLWVDNKLIIDNWAIDATRSNEAVINLVKGRVPIQLEFAEFTWAAICKLSWRSPSIPQQIIPKGQFTQPLRAVGPKPFDGDTQASSTPTLSWIPGVKAASHDVYFGDKWDDVNDANNSWPVGTSVYKGNQDVNYYKVPTPPAPLEWGKTYYWRVDEVNNLHPDKMWRGSIRQFTTLTCLVVDDFEDYNDTAGHRIWEKWKANSTGKAGYSNPSYAERTIIHRDNQSIPFDYNNLKLPYYSDANRTFDTDQNWVSYKLDPTHIYPLKSLTLWFRGYPERVGSFSYTGTANPYAATMYACGANIGDVPDMRNPSRYHDECHFGYKAATSGTTTTLPGSTTSFTGVKIVAKVEGFSNPANSLGKAGVMIRDTMDANAFNAYACVRRTAANTYGVAFSYRSTAKGGTTTSTTNDVNDVGITLPCWVALTLQTSSSYRNVRAYYSKNSTNGTDGKWYPFGPSGTTPTVVNFPIGTMCFGGSPAHGPLYIGLAATPQSDTAKSIAQFSSVTLTAGAAGTWQSRDISIKSNVAAPLYVTLQDSNPSPGTKTVTHPDPNIVLQAGWQEWNIALSDFTGVNLTKVKKITLGVGDSTPRGTGTLYFDDIRVYVSRCIANRKAPDFSGSDCRVDPNDLRILTDNWLISEYEVAPLLSWDPNNDANLAAWYKFENNLTDSAPHGPPNYNGDPCGTPSYVAGKAGQALSLDGINDGVVATRMIKDDFTLMTWIKTDTPGAQAGTRAYQGSGLIWSDVGGGGYDFILAVLGTKLTFATGPNDVDTTSSGNVVFSPAQWVHVAVVRTRSSGRTELYINGMLDTAVVSNNTSSLTANPQIKIGANTIDERYYRGLIDEVRIYSRALSQGEVAYLAGKTSPFTQPLSSLLTNPAVNLYNDGRIDIRDYAVFASKWLETLLFP